MRVPWSDPLRLSFSLRWRVHINTTGTAVPAGVTSDAQRVTRSAHEARSASDLTHPNVCVVHALDVTDRRHFIAIEYVAGRTLREWLSRERAAAPLREVLDIAITVTLRSQHVVLTLKAVTGSIWMLDGVDR